MALGRTDEKKSTSIHGVKMVQCCKNTAIKNAE